MHEPEVGVQRVRTETNRLAREATSDADAVAIGCRAAAAGWQVGAEHVAILIYAWRLPKTSAVCTLIARVCPLIWPSRPLCCAARSAAARQHALEMAGTPARISRVCCAHIGWPSGCPSKGTGQHCFTTVECLELLTTEDAIALSPSSLRVLYFWAIQQSGEVARTPRAFPRSKHGEWSKTTQPRPNTAHL